MEQLSDEILMSRVQQEELQCMEELFERYNKRLYNYYLRLTFDRDLSLDMVQNVFYRILKYRQAYKTDCKFKPWLYQVARNVHMDHYRKQKMQKDSFADIDAVADMVDSEGSEQDHKEKLLHKAMAALPTEKRELLVMSRFQGMKYEEIGEVLGLTVSNIKVKVHRAMKELKQLYFQEETV